MVFFVTHSNSPGSPGWEGQYNTIVQDTGYIWFYRQVDGIISIRVPIDANVYLRTETDQKESVITVGDGSGAIIEILQVQWWILIKIQNTF